MPLQVGSLVITDPVAAPVYADGPISRWSRRNLYQPRDEVFVRLSLRMAVLMTALMAALVVAVRVYALPALPCGALYLAVWGWSVPPVVLMLHCTMHRPFIRQPRWLNRVHQYAMTFFFGIPPAYPDHHLGMHHADDNMPADLSSTTRYRRDSFLHFLVYFGRFFFFGLVELSLYLRRARKVRMMRRMLAGELGHIALIAIVCWLDPRIGVFAFLLPTVIIRFMMMAGNWGQHAFLNTGRPNSGLSNAITCVNATYNHRAFNDGYHIGHHLRASRHWTELPQDLVDNHRQYVDAGAIVFQGVDFFLVSLLLWTGQWKRLARCYVRLDGVERSDAEVIALLKSRVQPVRVFAPAALDAVAFPGPADP